MNNLQTTKMLCLSLVLTFAFLSCGYFPVGLAPSTGPIDNNNITVLGHATGEMSYFSLLGIIPFGKPEYDTAIADAISKFDEGKGLINVRVTQKTTWVIVGFIHKLVIEGDVIK